MNARLENRLLAMSIDAATPRSRKSNPTAEIVVVCLVIAALCIAGLVGT